MKLPSLARLALAVAAVVLFSRLPAQAAPEIGKPAPEFTLTDSNGTSRSLKDFHGKVVVLEWLNHGCPFVRKHYESGNMQKLQETYTAKGVVWLSIISSAKGKEGYVTPAQANKDIASNKGKATAVLLDASGKVGKAYGAKTTPHMFVINADGQLVYMGAIDDKASVDQADVAGAKNYVSAALDAVLAGKPVETPSTTPYGCFVKYK